MFLDGVISRSTVVVGLDGLDKWTVITKLVDAVMASGKGKGREAILDAVMAREQQGSTGLEKGIAVPHARCEGVDEVVAALGIANNGIDFDSADGKPCRLVFLIVAPPRESTRYLKVLAGIAAFGMSERGVSTLASAQSVDDVFALCEELTGSLDKAAGQR